MKSFIPLVILMLLGCGAGPGNQLLLQIRISNETPHVIDKLWLGAGARGGATQDTEFGPMEQGGMSPYEAIEAVRDNYRKLNFVIDGKRYNAVVELPEHDFMTGYYTFVCSLEVDTAIVTVIAEEET